MNQPSEYVRSDTPDPRVGAYHKEDEPVARSHLDISSAWQYMGTNNSALKGAALSRPVSGEYTWTPTAIGLHENSKFPFGAGSFKHKRHWQTDDRFLDDTPPCKVHVNEEKVAQQFHSMSLCSDNQPSYSNNLSTSMAPNPLSDTGPNTASAMWDRFYELENKLLSSPDIEVDEGVDMGGDVDSTSPTGSTTSQEPVLHISPNLTGKLNVNPLPQILVPKPCKEVVLWQPSGVDLIKESVTQVDMSSQSSQSSSSSDDSEKATRKKKTATRMLSSSPFLLAVPTMRPDTPPPNARTNPLSQGIPVCFVDESRTTSQMDI